MKWEDVLGTTATTWLMADFFLWLPRMLCDYAMQITSMAMIEYAHYQ
jgi:hypothetical protein